MFPACMQLRSWSRTLLAYVMPVVGGMMLAVAIWSLFLSPVRLPSMMMHLLPCTLSQPI